MDSLILDDGKIRNCPNNKAKMSYFEVYKNFHGYKKEIKEILSFTDDIKEAFSIIFNVLIYIILFPITPFLRAVFDKRRCDKMVEKENILNAKVDKLAE